MHAVARCALVPLGLLALFLPACSADGGASDRGGFGTGGGAGVAGAAQGGGAGVESSPACREIAELNSWEGFSCDADASGPCGGSGVSSVDCVVCCEAAGPGSGGAGGASGGGGTGGAGAGGVAGAGGMGATGGVGAGGGGAGGTGGAAAAGGTGGVGASAGAGGVGVTAGMGGAAGSAGVGATGGTGGLAGSAGTAGMAGAAGSGGVTLGFGYPVGDKTTGPAGGWQVWQVLSAYNGGSTGRHLAQDISLPGGVAAVDEPVYAVADGVVLYAKPNSTSYQNVVLIEHDLGDGTVVCSFYGNLNPPLVTAGATVSRAEQIATVLDWADNAGPSDNTHLHYVLLSEDFCAQVASTGNSGGSGVCGYDGGGPNGVAAGDLSAEPFSYTAVDETACGSSAFPDAYISPSQFIALHHF